MTLRELGDRMGVSRPTIYAYASGALKMSRRRLLQAAELTGKSIDYFLPRGVGDLDPKSVVSQNFRLIDALLAPPDAQNAVEVAKETLEATKDNETPGVRAEVLLKLGVSLTGTGDYVTAIRHLESAYNSFLADEDKPRQASCLQTLGFCYLGLGQTDRAKDCFEGAKSVQTPELAWRPEVALAGLAERIGDFTEAEERLSGLLDDPFVKGASLTYVRANFASVVCARGRWKSGLAQTETALASAYATKTTDQVAELLIQSALALTHLGRLDEATMMIVRAKDVTFSLQDEARATFSDAVAAGVLLAFGDERAAREAISAAMSRAIGGQYRRSESFCLQLMTELALKRQDFEGALDTSVQLRSHASAHHFVVAEAFGYLYECQARSGLGQTNKSREALVEARSISARVGPGRLQALVLGREALQHMTAGELEPAASKAAAALAQAQDNGLLLDLIGMSEEFEQFDWKSTQIQGHLGYNESEDRERAMAGVQHGADFKKFLVITSPGESSSQGEAL